MTRAVWIDAGNDPDYAKLATYGIASSYFDPRDPRVTRVYMDNVAAHGQRPGLYFAANWYPALDGPGFAETCDAALKRIAWRGNAPVCLDIETHDIRGYVLPCLKRWRELRPTRQTAWTLEGFQGGLFEPDDVQAVLHANVGVVPQNYTGSMDALAADRVALDLVAVGFPASVLHGFYDGANLPLRWDGYVFTQGRLP